MKPIQIHTIHPKGWPITFEVEPGDPKLSELIAYLGKLGFRPLLPACSAAFSLSMRQRPFPTASGACTAPFTIPKGASHVPKQ